MTLILPVLTNIIQLLTNLDSNETVDLSQPHLRQLFSSHPWLLVTVIVLYVILIIIGLLGNLLLLIMLLRQVFVKGIMTLRTFVLLGSGCIATVPSSAAC